jgi:hypothetical protein
MTLIKPSGVLREDFVYQGHTAPSPTVIPCNDTYANPCPALSPTEPGAVYRWVDVEPEEYSKFYIDGGSLALALTMVNDIKHAFHDCIWLTDVALRNSTKQP